MPDREKVIRELQDALKDAEEDGKFYAEIRRPDVFDAIALLKEQEPVEPIYGLHGERRCGVCRNKFFVYKQLFCASCGRAAKWDD